MSLLNDYKREIEDMQYRLEEDLNCLEDMLDYGILPLIELQELIKQIKFTISLMKKLSK